MAVRKRGDTWQIDYIDPAGKRIRKSFKKKKDADAEHGKRRSLIAEGRYLDVKKDCKTTFGELVKKYDENFNSQRSFDGWKKLCLSNFKEHFNADTVLSKIRYVDLETYRNHLRQKKTYKDTIRTDASINRELSCLHHLFTKGVEWELIEQNPFDRGKTLRVKENNSRLRYLSEDEITRLLGACTSHLKNIVICALNTGMRRGEILSLRWDQVKNGFIYLHKTKTDTPRQIPINDTLNELFKGIRRVQKVGTEYVFTFSPNAKQKEDRTLTVINPAEGNRINSVKSSFATAIKRAGINDFRFHDLRHTFASHMIMKGGQIKDVQEILGHKSLTMTLRYSHLSQDHKRKAVNLLNFGTQVKNVDMSQNVTNACL
jgi:integrase